MVVIVEVLKHNPMNPGMKGLVQDRETRLIFPMAVPVPVATTIALAFPAVTTVPCNSTRQACKPSPFHCYSSTAIAELVTVVQGET